MSRVGIVDTTLRDGHQCLWATRMTTQMMRPVLERMDRIGFDAIEVMGAVQFDTCVRFLKENPWQRLRLFRERLTRTKRQAIIRSKCALNFGLQPDDIAALWVERLIANGIERIIAFDGLHDLDNLVDTLTHAKELGAETMGWLIFSESPIHTDELYVAKAREFIERCRVDGLIIEDTSGILTPERVRTLVPALKREIGDVPLGLHTHNLAGLAQRTCIEAVRRGVDHLYTCIAPIADGNAPPAIQTTARNLRHLGHAVEVDGSLIDEVAGHFETVAVRDGKPLGRPQDFGRGRLRPPDPGRRHEQLHRPAPGRRPRRQARPGPGRMRPRARRPRLADSGDAVLAAHRGAGHPQRHRRQALWARPRRGQDVRPRLLRKLLAPVEPDVLDRIMENGSKAIATEPAPPEPALPGLRKRYPRADDEELMLRNAFPEAAVEAMLAAAVDEAAWSAAAEPFLAVIDEIARQAELDRVSIETGDFRLEVRRRAAATV